MMPTTLVLGVEYNKGLKRALRAVLVDLGAIVGQPEQLLAGSQDLTRWWVELDGAELIVEAETYAGLSLHGPRALVERVAEMVRIRMER